MEVPQAVLEARRRLKEKMGSGVVQVGGKGSMRRKAKHKPLDSKTNNNDKLDLILKKVGVSDFGEVEEIFIFLNNSSYLEFKRPKFLGAVKHCTFIVTGDCVARSVDMSSVFKGFRPPNPDSMSLNSDFIGKLRDNNFHDPLDDKKDNAYDEKKKNSKRRSGNKRNSDSSDSCNEGGSMFKKVRPDDEKERIENKDKKKGKNINKGNLTNGSGKEQEKSVENENEKREDKLNTNSAAGDAVTSDFIPEAVDDFEAYAKDA